MTRFKRLLPTVFFLIFCACFPVQAQVPQQTMPVPAASGFSQADQASIQEFGRQLLQQMQQFMPPPQGQTPAWRSQSQTGLPGGDPPEIGLKVDRGRIEYTVGDAVHLCSMGDVAGCAKIELFMEMAPFLSPFTGLRKVQINLGLSKINVVLSSEYQKGTCEFDLVLKHELTHVAFARKVVERYAPELAKAVLAKAETLPKPIDANGYAVLQKTAGDYFERLRLEQKRQDALLDEGGNNVYQWEQCKGIKK